MLGITWQSDDSSSGGGAGGTVGGLEGLKGSFKDLSAWRVSVPRVEQRIDHNNKPYCAFIVDVTRIDVTGSMFSQYTADITVDMK